MRNTNTASHLKLAAGLSIPVLLVLVAFFALLDTNLVFNLPFLQLALNLIFITFVSFVIAYLAARGFISSGSWPVLWLGGATLAFGICNVLNGWMVEWAGVNASVTTHNVGTLLSAFLHLLAAFFMAKNIASSFESVRSRLVTTAQIYTAIVLFLAFIAVISIQDLLPAFFIQGPGPMVISQITLGTAVFFITIAAAFFLRVYLKTKSDFVYWYSLGLFLTALGLTGILMVRVMGNSLYWLSVSVQYVGGIYLLMAVRAAAKEAHAHAVGIPETLGLYFSQPGTSYKLLVDTVADAIASVDNRGRVLMWNPAAEKTFFYTSNEVIGQKITDLIIMPRYREFLASWLESGRKPWGLPPVENIELEVRRKDGSVFPVALSCSSIYTYAGRYSVLVFSDITERRQVEELLRYQATLLNNVSDAVISTDREFLIRSWNRAAEKLYGWRAEEVVNRPIIEILKFQDGGDTNPEVAKDILANRGYRKGEAILKRKDGTDIAALISSATLKDNEGNFAGTVSVHHDVTRLRQAEAEHLLLLERWRVLFQVSMKVVAETSVEGVLQRVADAAKEITNARLSASGHGYMNGNLTVSVASMSEGYAPCPPLQETVVRGRGMYLELMNSRESVRLTDAELLSHHSRWGLPEGHAPLRGLLGARLVDRYGKPSGLIMVSDKVEGDFAEEDEILLRHLAAIASLALQHIEARTLAEHEAQEIKDMTELLVVQERLATLGKVAGSISHELRNPLATIDSSAFYLRRILGKTGELGKITAHIERIEKGVRRSTSIIESLLNLTRLKEPEVRDIELKAALDRVVSSTRIPPGITVIRDFPPQEVTATGDREQLSMAFGNIIKNAIEAMDGKGVLVLAIKRRDTDAEVSFTDTGPGIPLEHVKKIFEPLFTTKASGIGFGLAITRMVIEKHGGTIQVESEWGKGTVFIIRLPQRQAVETLSDSSSNQDNPV